MANKSKDPELEDILRRILKAEQDYYVGLVSLMTLHRLTEEARYILQKRDKK